MVKMQERPFIFLKEKDEHGLLINEKANHLYATLRNIDVERLEIGPDFKNYFIQHHLGNRLFFSLQNSAGILYHSIKKNGCKPADINFVDYGAGLGTLYLLAGMIGLKRVIYNDYLPEWKTAAAAISEALQIKIDAFITGDIDAVLNEAENAGFRYHIIASRNVIEHIYSLPAFFNQVYVHNPNAVVYSTTTANFQNPVMRLHHYRIHTKIEFQQYLPYRKKYIQELWPGISGEQLDKLAALTRGKAKEDFTHAINSFKQNQPVTAVPFLRSNTCLPDSGYWCEHLLSKNEYLLIGKEAGFTIDYLPGYWDTHYRSALMNFIGRTMNVLIGIFGKKGCWFSPFVNIIAYQSK